MNVEENLFGVGIEEALGNIEHQLKRLVYINQIQAMLKLEEIENNHNSVFYDDEDIRTLIKKKV